MPHLGKIWWSRCTYKQIYNLSSSIFLPSTWHCHYFPRLMYRTCKKKVSSIFFLLTFTAHGALKCIESQGFDENYVLENGVSIERFFMNNLN